MLRPLAALLALTLATPVFAGASEDAVLSKLVGVFSGTGTLSGSESGQISCKLTVSQRKDGVSYSSKCQVPKYGNQSFSGVITYNDAKHRYEAKSGGKVTVGEKSGSTLVFNAKMTGLAVGTSVMRLSPTKVTVDTVVKQPGAKGQIKTHIDMKR